MLEYWEEKSLSVKLFNCFIPIIPIFRIQKVWLDGFLKRGEY
jgi:hypothetical protein